MVGIHFHGSEHERNERARCHSTLSMNRPAIRESDNKDSKSGSLDLTQQAWKLLTGLLVRRPR